MTKRIGVCFEEFLPAPARAMSLLGPRGMGADHVRCWEDPGKIRPTPDPDPAHWNWKKFDQDVQSITDAGMTFYLQLQWWPRWMTRGEPAYEEGIHGVWVANVDGSGHHVAGSCRTDMQMFSGSYPYLPDQWPKVLHVCRNCVRESRKVEMVHNLPPISRDEVWRTVVGIFERYGSKIEILSPANEPDESRYYPDFYWVTQARDSRTGEIGSIDAHLERARSQFRDGARSDQEIEQLAWGVLHQFVRRVQEPKQVFDKLYEDIIEPAVEGALSVAPQTVTHLPEASALESLLCLSMRDRLPASAKIRATGHPYIWGAGPWPEGSYIRGREMAAKAKEFGFDETWMSECADEKKDAQGRDTNDGDLPAYFRGFDAIPGVVGVTLYEFWRFFGSGTNKDDFFADIPLPNSSYAVMQDYLRKDKPVVITPNDQLVHGLLERVKADPSRPVAQLLLDIADGPLKDDATAERVLVAADRQDKSLKLLDAILSQIGMVSR